MLQRVGLPFYQALDCVEGGKVHEGVTAWTDICISMGSVSQHQKYSVACHMPTGTWTAVPPG